MKVKVATTRNVAEAVEDGYAVFNCGYWFTTYRIHGSDAEYFVDGFGYAYEIRPELIERAHEAGGFRKKAELNGVRLFNSKPYMGKDD